MKNKTAVSVKEIRNLNPAQLVQEASVSVQERKNTNTGNTSIKEIDP